MIALDEAADVPEAGGKARSLASARRAGLPVPDGFVVLPSEEMEEAELERQLERLLVPTRLARLRREEARGHVAAFAVRSSALVEDTRAASAAGLFASAAAVSRARGGAG